MKVDCYDGFIAQLYWTGGPQGIPDPKHPKFEALLRQISSPGLYRSCDIPTGYGSFIYVDLPSGAYRFDDDNKRRAQVDLVLTEPQRGVFHGTLDATLPFYNPFPNMMAYPSATATLHIDF